MSRTYRKVPHWISNDRLRDDFEDGCGHWAFNRNARDFTNSDDYVKAATAHFSGERGTGWRGMKNNVSPANGNVIGFEDDATRCSAARLRTNKIRRALDRKEIDEAISEMVEDAQDALAEMMDWAMDERDDFDAMHWCDWDDYLTPDPVEEEQVDYCDPYYDWDYEYDY